MLDYLIFNKLKWFNVTDNAETVNVNGKSYTAVPKQIEIPAGASWHEICGGTVNQGEWTINEPITVNCIGAISDAYLFVGRIHNTNDDSYFNLDYPGGDSNEINLGLILKNKVSKVNWGGIKPPRPLLIRLCATLRRAVIL